MRWRTADGAIGGTSIVVTGGSTINYLTRDDESLFAWTTPGALTAIKRMLSSTVRDYSLELSACLRMLPPALLCQGNLVQRF